MWPWDHAAVGYLLLSAATRLGWRRPPARQAGVVAVFAALLPDLIDKPLSWGLALLPSGRSLGHSLLFALLLVVLVGAVTVAARRREFGLAFGIGYLSHLAGDVAYPLFVKGELRLGFLFWPLVTGEPSGSGGGLPYLTELVAEFVAFLLTPAGLLYVAADIALLGGAAAVWLLDSRPVESTEGPATADD